MFSKLYPARIERVNLVITRIKKEDRRTISAVMVYDLTVGLAQAIGGDAPALAEMLARGGDLPSRLAGCRLHLDTKTVQISLNAGGDDKQVIEHTTSMSARAMAPTAESAASPSLLVKVTWLLDESGSGVDFLRRHLGETIKVRMDRKQGELPFDGSGDGDPN